MAEQLVDLLLHGRLIGQLSIREDYSRFWLLDEYIEDANRAVLGLLFEDDLRKTWRAHQRVPPWFSNLLPEGDLRNIIARDLNVSSKREAQLLLGLGRDLPGAVEIRVADHTPVTPQRRESEISRPLKSVLSPWRFSLAGVAIKFSAIKVADRFTLPASDHDDADWIVKLPDRVYPSLPENEFAMMSLARMVGIDVPETLLVHRDALPPLPDHLWPKDASIAYAIRRFDRTTGRQRVHMEDFAQVRNLYPEDRYNGNFETVASICYRGHDSKSLVEFARRMVFNVLIGNGGAHLKNWSLIYPDQRRPQLSPAYDLVSTRPYIEQDQLALKFNGSHAFERFRISALTELQRKLGAQESGLEQVARETIQRTSQAWRLHGETLLADAPLRKSISKWMDEQQRRLT